jgi:hypothetical protein
VTASRARDAALALVAGLPVLAFLLEYGGVGSDVHPGVLAPGVRPFVAGLPKLLFLWLAVWYGRRTAHGFDPDNPMRPAWSLLAGGMLAFALGQSILAFHTLLLGAPTPFPSLADVGFLLGYLLLFAALSAFISAYRRAGLPIGNPAHHVAVLVALLVVLTLGGYPIMEPILATPAPALELFLNVAYPSLDLLLLLPSVALLRMALAFRGGRVWRVWVALLVGFVLLSVGDILFAYQAILGRYELEPLNHATVILSYALLARGITYQHELLTA